MKCSLIFTRHTLSIFLLLNIFTLASCGSASSSADPRARSGPGGSTVVQITLSDYKIAASLTSFTVGTAYHFEVTNKGIVDHEFMIIPPMPGELSMNDIHKTALAYIDVVPPGTTKTLDYTFTKAASKLEFACHIGHHYALGMQLSIGVKPR